MAKYCQALSNRTTFTMKLKRSKHTHILQHSVVPYTHNNNQFQYLLPSTTAALLILTDKIKTKLHLGHLFLANLILYITHAINIILT
jgi:hypothetical protein